ncbi:MAG: T9SS type A sorting domain-containing protein [candidate division KSB1 bacterium]|nr:T9SS type A sorting domain-containing protein [candidate division KSB1 bacterium]
MHSLQRTVCGACAAVALLLSALAATAGDDHWSTGGPAMGSVQRIACTPGRPELLFVHMGEAGLFMSEDTGHNWRSCAVPPWGAFLASGGSSWDIADIAVSPHPGNPVYYATPLFLFTTSDLGHTWQMVGYPIMSLAFAPTALLVDPRQAGVLVMGHYTSLMVTVSLDGGLTWKKANAGLPGSRVVHMSFDAGGDTLLLAATNGVFRRPWPPGGKGDWLWSDISYNLAGRAVLAVLPPKPGTREIVVGTQDGVYVGDGASAWRDITGSCFRQRRVEIGALAWGDADSELLYVGTSDGLYVTADLGLSWQEWDAGLGNTSINCILPMDSTHVLLGTCDGLYAADDGGKRWARRGAGLVAAECYFLTFDTTRLPSRVWTGIDGGGLYYSDDCGATWVDANVDRGWLDVSSMAVTCGPQPALYAPYIKPAGPPKYFSDGIMASSDAGVTWSDVTGQLAGLIPLCVAADPYDPAVIYCGTFSGGILKTTDGGASWHRKNEGLPEELADLVVTDPRAPQVVYAGVLSNRVDQPHGLYRSVDGGEHWEYAFPPYFAGTWRHVMDLAVNPKNSRTLFAAVYYDWGVHKSLDGGRSWVPANTGIALGQAHCVVSVAIDPVDTNIVYAAGTEIYVSYDAGATWQQFQEGVPSHFVAVRKIRVDPKDPSYIYAATEGSGVLVYHRTQSRVHRDRPGTPESFYLAQNFPNPFHSSTLLRFGVPSQADVQLEVFDVSGRRVRLLADEHRAPGHYSVVWDGRGDDGVRVPAGVYFCRLRAGQVVQVRKMTLVY